MRTLELEVKYDFQAQRIVGQALMNGFQYDAAAHHQNAKTAVNFAKELISKQESLAQNSPAALENSPAKLNERQFLAEALRTGIGKANFDAIRNEYDSRAVTGEFSKLI